MIPTNVSFTADLRSEISVSERNGTNIHHLSDYVGERVNEREDRLLQTAASVAREMGRKITRNKGVESRGAAHLLFFSSCTNTSVRNTCHRDARALL